MESGVKACITLARMTTLTLSTNPQRNSIKNDNQNQRESPKPMVATPKAATAHSNECPAFWIGGRCARMKVHTSEPMGRASCKKPRPKGPTLKMRSA